MNCPVCETKLRTITKHSVEVDICPDCKGVWLDRGELDKIIEMNSVGGPAEYAAPVEHKAQAPSQSTPPARDNYDRDNAREERSYKEEQSGQYDHRDSRGRPKRKESWFSEMFDMFGD